MATVEPDGTDLDPDRPSVEWRDHTVGGKAERWLHIRASALGQCPKALAAMATGAVADPFPKPVLDAFARGHRLEDEIAAAYKVYCGCESTRGLRFDHQVKASRVFDVAGTKVIIEGHTDCVVTSNNTGMSTIVDYKTSSKPMTRASCNLLADAYRWQVTAYRHCVESYDVYTTAELYVAFMERDTDDVEQIAGFEAVDVLTYDLDDLKARLEQIVELAGIAAGSGLEALQFLPCEPGAFGCPVQSLHPLLQPAQQIGDWTGAPEDPPTLFPVTAVIPDVSAGWAGLPKEVQDALPILKAAELHRTTTPVSAANLAAAKKTVKAYMTAQDLTKVETSDLELAIGKTTSKEVVDISPDELRGLLGDGADKYIQQQQRQGSMTVRFKK